MKEEYDNGKYEGDMLWDGKMSYSRHGHGTYTFASGDKYVGEYQDGKMHGQGTLTWADGTKKTGCFINDQYMPDICEGMGFVKGTEAYTNCVLELIKKL